MLIKFLTVLSPQMLAGGEEGGKEREEGTATRRGSARL